MESSKLNEKHYILVCLLTKSSLPFLKHIQSTDQHEPEIVVLTIDPLVVEMCKQKNLTPIKVQKDNMNSSILNFNVIQKVVYFEESIDVTRIMLKDLRNQTTAPIYVVTPCYQYPTQLYKLFGAKNVIYTRSNNISYLMK